MAVESGREGVGRHTHMKAPTTTQLTAINSFCFEVGFEIALCILILLNLTFKVLSNATFCNLKYVFFVCFQLNYFNLFKTLVHELYPCYSLPHNLTSSQDLIRIDHIY